MLMLMLGLRIVFRLEYQGFHFSSAVTVRYVTIIKRTPSASLKETMNNSRHYHAVGKLVRIDRVAYDIQRIQKNQIRDIHVSALRS